MVTKWFKSIFSNPIDYIFFGLTLHAVGQIFTITNKPLTYLFCGLGLVFIIYSLLFKIRNYKFRFSGVFGVIFLLFLLVSIFTIIRGVWTSGSFELKGGLSPVNPFGFMFLLIPLILLIDKNDIKFNSIFLYTVINGIIGLVLLFNSRGILLNSDNANITYFEFLFLLETPCFFMFNSSIGLLLFQYNRREYRLLNILFFLLGFFILLIFARRSWSFLFAIICFFSGIIYSISDPKKIKSRFVIFVIITIGVISFFVANLESLFSNLNSRLTEDTRTEVVQSMLTDFGSDVSDWTFGRGINGTYYCNVFEDSTADQNQRSTMETGYLFIILKGGILLLVLYVLVLLIASFNGLFRSNNTFVKGLSLYILAHIIFLIPYGVPSFSLQYVILWISVLFCQSHVMRKMSSRQIRFYIKSSYLKKDRNFLTTFSNL